MYDINVNDLPGKLLEIVHRVIHESARCSQHFPFIEVHKHKVEDATTDDAANGCAFYLVITQVTTCSFVCCAGNLNKFGIY